MNDSDLMNFLLKCNITEVCKYIIYILLFWGHYIECIVSYGSQYCMNDQTLNWLHFCFNFPFNILGIQLTANLDTNNQLNNNKQDDCILNSSNRKIVHSQYNSPWNIYSDNNIHDSLEGAIDFLRITQIQR